MTAVLFDLDGTLMNTPRVIIHALRHVLGPASERHADAQLAPHIGRPLDAIMADLFPQASAAMIEEKKQVFRDAFREATVPDARHLVFDHVRELLDHLKSEGITAAIVTSKVTASALELLDAGQLRDSFTAVIGHDQAVAGKPAPDLALVAASRLQAEANQCIVVGDSPDDMRMGFVAGMHTIGVTWGVGDRDTLQSSGASSIATSPKELQNAIFAFACRSLTRHARAIDSEPPSQA